MNFIERETQKKGGIFLMERNSAQGPQDEIW